MSRYNHYLPLTDNETEPRELGTQDLTMESALRVHTLNTIGRELNYGQNSTSLVQWVGSRETWVTFMNQILCWSKAIKLWVGSQELRRGCKSARLKALLHLLCPTSQVFSPWSWCFRSKVSQDMALLEPWAAFSLVRAHVPGLSLSWPVFAPSRSQTVWCGPGDSGFASWIQMPVGSERLSLWIPPSILRTPGLGIRIHWTCSCWKLLYGFSLDNSHRTSDCFGGSPNSCFHVSKPMKWHFWREYSFFSPMESTYTS